MIENKLLEKIISIAASGIIIGGFCFVTVFGYDYFRKYNFPSEKDQVNVRKLTMINNSFAGVVEVYEIKTYEKNTCFVSISTIPNNPAMAINMQCL